MPQTLIHLGVPFFIAKKTPIIENIKPRTPIVIINNIDRSVEAYISSVRLDSNKVRIMIVNKVPREMPNPSQEITEDGRFLTGGG